MTAERFSSSLEKVALDAVDFRHKADAVVAVFSKGSSARNQLLELLICTSELYLDYLFFTRNLPAFTDLSVDRPETKDYSSNVQRERTLRSRFRAVLERSDSWKHADVQNSLAEQAGFRTRNDYIESFTLHLPEIYEETYLIEECARHFASGNDAGVLIGLTIGLQHLACNHISFVQPALQWASVETFWKDDREP